MQRSLSRKNPLTVSPEIRSLAEKEGLGELCKVYPVWKPGTGFWPRGLAAIGLGVLVLVVTAILIVATLFSAILSLLNVIFGLAALGILLLIAGCYLCFSRRIYAHWQVSLWQHGFIYEKKQIRQIFRWDQIESIQGSVMHVHNGPAAIVYRSHVHRQDGYEVKLGLFSDAPELIDSVLEKFVHQLAPQELRITPPASIMTFTTFKLNQQGIGDEQEMHSWQEIQEFMTKNGTITLRKKE